SGRPEPGKRPFPRSTCGRTSIGWNARRFAARWRCRRSSATRRVPWESLPGRLRTTCTSIPRSASTHSPRAREYQTRSQPFPAGHAPPRTPANEAHMKAIVFARTGDAEEVLDLADRVEAELRPGDVRIRVTARPIQPADRFFIRGQYRIPPV